MSQSIPLLVKAAAPPDSLPEMHTQAVPKTAWVHVHWASQTPGEITSPQLLNLSGLI